MCLPTFTHHHAPFRAFVSYLATRLSSTISALMLLLGLAPSSGYPGQWLATPRPHHGCWRRPSSILRTLSNSAAALLLPLPGVVALPARASLACLRRLVTRTATLASAALATAALASITGLASIAGLTTGLRPRLRPC